ncbi:MAG: hypothetical protein QOE65_153 [Solirubrobacteraceae bacterium]|nr:hypothetical protein [Solirubrobacteraceae bacterium]
MSYEVRADPGVSEDLQSLAAEQENVPADWRLAEDEIRPALTLAIQIVESLREDPFQGEPMEGRANAQILRGCRRLKFDPREPWPRGPEGRPRPRMRVVWTNEPDESTVALVRVLAITHRFDSRPYRAAAARLGAARRQGSSG